MKKIPFKTKENTKKEICKIHSLEKEWFPLAPFLSVFMCIDCYSNLLDSQKKKKISRLEKKVLTTENACGTVYLQCCSDVPIFIYRRYEQPCTN